MEFSSGRQNISDTDKNNTALLIRFGGLDLPNPYEQFLRQLCASDLRTEELQELIISGEAFRSDPHLNMETNEHTPISHKMFYEEVLGKTDEETLRNSASKRNLNRV